jgi:hypothetical protein
MYGAKEGVSTMKIIAMLGAATLAIGAIGATPADAQRYGWDGHRGGPGWNGGGYRGGHGYRGDRGYRGYRGGYRHRGYRGYRGGYGRTRVVCRVQRGYYGPVRRCFRVHR